jgi:N-acetylglucosamine kinase-like BadF-type ATPase
MRILIADSGSTKTDWLVINDGMQEERFHTGGMNPFFRTVADMNDELRSAMNENNLLPAFDAVYFYGAGCTPEKIPVIREVISLCIETTTAEIASDMLGAARGTAGREPAIVGILGTGANSCMYDGQNIVDAVPALGFILGDEGSGAVLGRLLVNYLLKNRHGAENIRNELFEQYAITQADIMERVYRGDNPNRFLASLSPFLACRLHEQALHKLAAEAFTDFFTHNIMQYDDYRGKPVYLVGSVAYHYAEVIREAAARCEVNIKSIVKSPMDGLRRYHS